MQTEAPVLHGLVVPEELEGPVKRPGWNSCDQPVFRAAERFRCDSLPTHGGTLVQHLSATLRKLSEKAAESLLAGGPKSCAASQGNPVRNLLREIPTALPFPRWR